MVSTRRGLVWGTSAGGHLAALLGTSGGVSELEGKTGGNLGYSSRVGAVVEAMGPTDLLREGEQFPKGAAHRDVDAPDSFESLLIGHPIRSRPDLTEKANPISYLGADDAETPPFLILHGDQDHQVPHGQSRLLFEALKGAGVDATFLTLNGEGHDGPGFYGPAAVGAALGFFDAHLKGL
jgi:acetyl esterase/lipase